MSKARILVVEDEGIIAEDIQMSLQDFGYEVLSVVTTGEESIRRAGEGRPDLVLMDVVLSGDMDGIEAATRIHHQFNIPIVYLTAYADDKMLERAKITEPFGYLLKPFRDRELHSTIEMALFKSKLESQLLESRQWLGVTLNNVSDGIIATDERGLIKLMNPVAEKITGRFGREVLDKHLVEEFCIVASDDGCSFKDLVDRMIAGNGLNGNASQELILITPSGQRILIELDASRIHDKSGRIEGMVICFRDITERKNAEEHLKLLSEAITQISEGIVVTGLDGKTIFSNNAYAEMHGYAAEELIGEHFTLFHKLEDHSFVVSLWSRLLSEGQLSGEIDHVRKDGSTFPGLTHNTVFRIQDGTPIGVIGTLRDITDLKDSQEELRKSHEALALYSSSLEQKVEERTRDLEASRAKLKKYSESLEKTNEALKIIIEGIEEQKKDVEMKISHNLNLTVRPILDQLLSQDVSETVQFLINSLDYNLTNMFSSFGFKMVKNSHLLTPREIRICEMVRSGLSSKQMAKVMGISPQTVLVHRKNIRKKLSLGRSGQNLASYLKTNL